MLTALQIIHDLLARGSNKTLIAREIGYSRPALSRYLSGTYGAGTDKIEKAIKMRYEKRICPHDGVEKPPAHCRRIALRPRPQGFPDAETQWKACQTCPNRPQQEESCKPQ